MSLFRTLKCFMSAFRISYLVAQSLRAVISHPTSRNLMNDETTARFS